MKKIISILITMAFLCPNVAFGTPKTCSTLRPPMQSNEPMKEFIKDRNEEEGEPLASGHTIEAAQSLVREKLKNLKLSIRTEEQGMYSSREIYVGLETTIEAAARQAAYILKLYGDFDIQYLPRIEKMAEDWSTGAAYDPPWSRQVTREEKIIVSPPKAAMISSRVELWRLRLSKMSEDDIGRCMLSLVQSDGVISYKLKKAIIKTLTKLQDKRPEAIIIIREKGLELLRLTGILDFTAAYIGTFVGDYSVIRYEMQSILNKFIDRAVPFEELFNSVIEKIKVEKPEDYKATRNMHYVSDKRASRLERVFEYMQLYGDAKIRYSYTSPEIYEVSVQPVALLSMLKTSPVLFLDTEVTANSGAFKQGLAQLKSNEGNIPVVLLTEETKDSIIAKLKGIDLTGVQFRNKAELGLQDLDWGKDERVSLIDGIDNLKCIPLTSALCETYKDLQKVRDQV